MRQRCKACPWGGVRAKLKMIFANSAYNTVGNNNRFVSIAGMVDRVERKGSTAAAILFGCDVKAAGSMNGLQTVSS